MNTRERLYEVIFGTDTKAGKLFDVVLLWVISISVIFVMLESVPAIAINYGSVLLSIEMCFTFIFSIEYLIRVWISPRPLRYIFSFWGMVDLFSILPTYLILLFPNFHYFIVIRALRLLRVFRIIKLVRFVSETQVLGRALKSSIYKISTFLFTILAIVTLMGTVMYVVEDGENGFTSIPQSIYWAIITITTVGYGDIVPHTALGKLISSVIMIIGYAIIAVPTGIFTAEFTRAGFSAKKNCTKCNHHNDVNAAYCGNCGGMLENLK